MDCYIHIGLHKTGSTSIQNFLQLNRDILFNQGISMPNFDCQNHSAPIFSMYTKKPHLYMQNVIQNRCNIDSIRQYNNNNKNILHTSITKNPGHIFIISGEGISRLDSEELLFFKNDLKKYFQHIFILSYIREPFSYATSLINQLHKLYGGLMRNYVKKIKNDACFFINYESILKKFISIFGENNVICVNYNRESFRNKNVIFDFIDRLKIENKKNYTYPDKKNISLKKEASILFDVINEELPLFFDKEFPVHELPFSSSGIICPQRHLLRTKIRNILNSYGSNNFWIDNTSPYNIYNKIQPTLDWLYHHHGICFTPPKDTTPKQTYIPPHAHRTIKNLRSKLSDIQDNDPIQRDIFLKYFEQSLQEITISFQKSY